MLILVPCGAAKRDLPSPARDLYVGGMFRMALKAAEAIAKAQGGKIMILSGLHGLLELDQVIAPYEQRMGEPGCVSTEELRRQAVDYGLIEERQVLVLAGRTYADAAQSVWPDAQTPLAGLKGIGYQRQVLSRVIRGDISPVTP